MAIITKASKAASFFVSVIMVVDRQVIVVKKFLLLFCLFLSLTASPALADSKKTKSKTSSPVVKVSNKDIKVDSKRSYVILLKDQAYLTSKLKASKKLIKKKAIFSVAYVRFTDKQVYYANKNHQWIPAASTHGTVWYQEDAHTIMVLSTDKKGKLSYILYNPAKVTRLLLTHNSYVYDAQGQLFLSKKSTITNLKKGQVLDGYSSQTVNGKKFYLTNKGWIKASNAKVVKK